MQGVIKSYDPKSATGVVVDDVGRSEYELATDALAGSVFPVSYTHLTLPTNREV
mgnify:CR=1 FL=1